MLVFKDAQSALGFVQTQLYRQEPGVYETKLPAFDYARFMSVDTSADEWDLGTYFFSSEIVGSPEWLHAKGFDMPYADVLRNQFVQEFHLGGIGYEWNLQEVNVAAKAGRNLGSEKGIAARKIAEAGLWSVSMVGRLPLVGSYNEKNLTGLLNDGSVPQANVAADGTGSSTLWSTKTPDQILRDINLGIGGVYSTTQETEMADTVLLPTARYLSIANTPRSANSDTTILDFLKTKNAYTALTGLPLKISAMRVLDTAGASSSARMVIYRNAPDVVKFHLPMPYKTLPPFAKSSMTTEVAGIFRTGGTEIRLPKAISYLDGI